MTNFWDLSTGEDINSIGTSFETGGGEIQPIPNDTTCVAIIDEAKWDQNRDGASYISLRWSVVQPAEYKNRKVFQKLWVGDADPRSKDPVVKRDKALKMFAAIDKNAGGKLVMSGKRPSDEMLDMALVNKPMQIKVMIWEMEGENGKMSGNWVSSIAPRGNAAAKPSFQPRNDDTPF
jgi:hypothetical protein